MLVRLEGTRHETKENGGFVKGLRFWVCVSFGEGESGWKFHEQGNISSVRSSGWRIKLLECQVPNRLRISWWKEMIILRYRIRFMYL